MTQSRIGDWMETFTGRQFWPLDPRPEEIHLLDIAHALANQCRFAGHCRQFYSVAQHSVIVSLIVPPEFAKWGLLHDAAEAYLVDLPRPVKGFSTIGQEYKKAEHRLMEAIAQRFGLDPVEPPEIKLADNVVLMTEKRDLLRSNLKWMDLGEPLSEEIFPVSADDAKLMFLDRCDELGLEIA